MSAQHRPVLVDEVLEGLAPKAGATIVDGTVGAGGHAHRIAQLLGSEGRVVGLDRDRRMLELAAEATAEDPVVLRHAVYSDLDQVLDDLEIDRVDGVLLDLGLSSDQLAWSERGFSFAQEGPLDMRFDVDGDSPTAADLVNTLGETKLADIFFHFGEERKSRRIARWIIEAREREPFRTTDQLARLVARCVPTRRCPGSIHPATRVFQALRIAVNDELSLLDEALGRIPDRLVPGGRFVIISFHSLEDRRVKTAFRDDDRLEILTRKPRTASEIERAENPRSRSAKLRVAQRCPHPN